MRHTFVVSLRFGWCLLLMLLVSAPALLAQGRRDSLIAQAKLEFVPAQRIPLLIAALDPAEGPPVGTWGDGVQALAQALVDDGQDSLAGLWLRWAARVSPALAPDTIQYTPQVTTALNAAREFVNETSIPGDTAVMTTWMWPAVGDRRVSGIQVQGGTSSPLLVSVDGAGDLGPGATTEVAPGSHDVRAKATGYDSVRVTREVLPRTMTVLRFVLRPSGTLVTAAQAPAPRTVPPQIPPTVSHKKFPWALAVLGAAGAGAAVVLLKGKGSQKPETGGITVTFTP